MRVANSEHCLPLISWRGFQALCLILLLQAMFDSSLNAQQSASSPDRTKSHADRLLSQYAFENWQIADGLPQNTVQSVVRTHDGYLWLGTVEGAARFDGISFEVFSKETFPLLTDNDVNAVFESRNGALYLGAEDGSIYRKASNGAAWQRFDKTNGLPGNAIWKFYEDHTGTLWISTLGGGLVQFRKGVFRAFTTADGLKSNDISKCFEDADGTLWFGTFGGGVHALRDGRIVKVFTRDDGLPSASVYDVVRDGAGTLWAGTEGGLVALAGERANPRLNALRFGAIAHPKLSTSFIWTMLDDGRGTLWIGSASGLWRYDTAKREIIDSLSALDGNLPSNDAYSLAFDHEGSLWLGTIGGGLCRLKKTIFIGVSAKEGLKTGFAWCGAERPNGELWIGTNNVGLVNIRHNRATPEAAVNALLTTQKIYGIHVGRSGTTYLATWGNGLITVAPDGRTTRRMTTKEGLQSNNLWTAIEDCTGAVWLGMGSGGLQCLKNGVLRSFGIPEGLAGTTVRRLAEDAEGNIWVGTLNGVNVIRADSVIAHYSTKNGLLSNSIRCIVPEKGSGNAEGSGGVWIGTPAGLHFVRNGIIKHITKKQGLFNDNVSGIVDDGVERYWMSCNYGVFSVEKSALWNVLEKRGERVKSSVYGMEDGLPSAECNAGNPGAWKLGDGRIAFATTKGIAFVNPRLIARDSVPPPVIIEHILADRTPQTLFSQSSIETRIAATTGRLTFTYTALSLLFPRRTRFKVRLEGYDADWQDVGTRREVAYTNLPRGKSYRFFVTAQKQDGAWNEHPASVAVYLQPLFYETWWFYGISICAVFGTAFGAYRLRTLQLKRRAAELARLVEERTSEVQEQMRLVEEKSSEITTTNTRLHGTNEQLERTNTELKRANEFKSTMLSMASHDLKNPLSSILALAEVTAQRKADTGVREMLGIIISAAEKMLQLVIDLLDTSALELGRIELHKAIVNATLLVDSVVEQYLPHAEKKGQILTWNADSICLVEADSKRLRQVADNLLSNAVKYSPKGGVITVSLRNMANNSGAAEVVLTVRDSGQGFSKADKEQMFGYFKRLSARPTGGESSTGVGLAIVKQIVELHGGSITVDSEFGNGATFTVHLQGFSAQSEHQQLLPLQAEHDDIASLTEKVGATICRSPKEQREAFRTALQASDYATLAHLAATFHTNDEHDGMIMLVLQSFAETKDGRALQEILTAVEAGVKAE